MDCGRCVDLCYMEYRLKQMGSVNIPASIALYVQVPRYYLDLCIHRSRSDRRVWWSPSLGAEDNNLNHSLPSFNVIPLPLHRLPPTTPSIPASSQKPPIESPSHMATSIPAGLRSADLGRFAVRAAQLESVKPVVAYWCECWT